ncbi:interleukin-1 receptor type 1 isoform X2 [Melanotaenia boesemani]|uniref:interleukin-1 receptor type 1 isoform X2 n=1 Tax=Melanotaenia boesemani TaxID=1250792 RepID=UPI001C04BF05|nr:interleukin-1 receptor type 1 isoform X2 [Melanotaenia boesemani]
MDASLLLFFIAGVISISEIRPEAMKSECFKTKLEIFKLIEGEAFYFEPYTLDDPKLPDEEFMWYKNGSQIEEITTDENNEIHYHGGGLFFLNVKIANSGNYTAKHTQSSGKCTIYNAKVEVYSASYQGNLNYLAIKNSDQNKKITCPQRIKTTCENFVGNFTWYKDSNLLPGEHSSNVWVTNATKDDEGIYTCVCTWTHHHRMYNSSATRELILLEQVSHRDVEILSPTEKEQFADKGFRIKLNCSIFCGKHTTKHCDASWLVNGKEISQMDGYSQTSTTIIQEPSMNTISTATLTIEKVSAEDFQREFKCIGKGLYKGNYTILTLKQRESAFPLVIGTVCVLLICVFAVVLVKYFAIDLALLLRPYFMRGCHDKDARLYDAYVVYQSQSLDKVTEDKLSSFVTKILPSVLEDKCGYRLFIQGRDDVPGEAAVTESPQGGRGRKWTGFLAGYTY